jgi:hypothetical protein
MINDITQIRENRYTPILIPTGFTLFGGSYRSVDQDSINQTVSGRKKRLHLASMYMDFVALILNKEKKVFATEINRGDGVAFSGIPGFYLVSDWSGEIFMINEETGKISLLNTKDIQMNTADICYITDKNLLIVPTFARNSLKAFNLKIL